MAVCWRHCRSRCSGEIGDQSGVIRAIAQALRWLSAGDADGEGFFGVEEGAGGGLDVGGGDGGDEGWEALVVVVAEAVEFVPAGDVGHGAVALLRAEPGGFPGGAGAVEFVRGEAFFGEVFDEDGHFGFGLIELMRGGADVEVEGTTGEGTEGLGADVVGKAELFADAIEQA